MKKQPEKKYPKIDTIISSGLTLRFSVKGHRYAIHPMWMDDALDDPFGGGPTHFSFEDIDQGRSFSSHISNWKKLLDRELEGGLTLRNNSDEMVFEPLYPTEE